MLTRNQIAIILLAIATAIIHFGRATVDPEIRVMFILNGLGYLVLVALLYLPQFQSRRALIRNILMVYTAITILFYFIWVAMSGEWNAPAGPFAKLIETALLYLLWRETF